MAGPAAASLLSSNDAIFGAQGRGGTAVRTTINIDDELLARATRLLGPFDRATVIHEGLRALIERESARRLARLGGTQRSLKAPPRRRLAA
jgi:Arc/MetJ family transcription regulator